MISRRTTIKLMQRFFSSGGSSVINTKGQGIKGETPKSHTVDFHYKDFDHLEFWSSNPKQTAIYYSSLFGFEIKQSQDIYSKQNTSRYYLENGNVRFLIAGPLNADNSTFSEFLNKHGDTVKGIGLRIDDIDKIYDHLKKKNWTDIEIVHDQQNNIRSIQIPMFASTTHTFIERNSKEEDGVFWQGLSSTSQNLANLNTINGMFDRNGITIPKFKKIDHVGFPQEASTSDSLLQKYYEDLGFHMFWYIDEKAISSEQSSLKSTVVSDYDHNVRFPIFEPVEKLKKSQIQEFLEYNGGAGTQHIAIEVDDILATVRSMKQRGVEFLPCNQSYYSMVFQKLSEYDITLKEDLEEIQDLNILIDFDIDGNYLLQIFTKPVIDRPTLFLEFIQREGHQGFGEGNFNRLFLSIENEQKRRGNLV
jgi:4-hydroxyphenylpyruvate dioxygenase